MLKLREAKYLAYEISHRLPAEGQAIPTPSPVSMSFLYPTSVGV